MKLLVMFGQYLLRWPTRQETDFTAATPHVPQVILAPTRRRQPLRLTSSGQGPERFASTAHYDPFRDEGEAYGARLHQAGVPVQVTRYLGMIHGFALSTGRYEQAERAIQQIADTLRARWQ